MYQLYAYGKKYRLHSSSQYEPKLLLIYPSNPQFLKPLEEFIYEGELVMHVIPFNLKNSLTKDDEFKELTKVFSIFNKNKIYDIVPYNLNKAAEDDIRYGK
jgi:hypothetical protein